MANNGYKQATVAYKTDINGQPVDINGQLTSVSGRKQSIALIAGKLNPNPALFEVEIIFNAGGYIEGTPSVIFDAVSCPFGNIWITPTYVVLTEVNPSATVILESDIEWVLLSYPSGIATIDTSAGSAGVYSIKLNRSETTGQGPYVFSNSAGQTATLWVANVIDTPWILATGEWNMLGFWYDNEIWNF